MKNFSMCPINPGSGETGHELNLDINFDITSVEECEFDKIPVNRREILKCTLIAKSLCVQKNSMK